MGGGGILYTYNEHAKRIYRFKIKETPQKDTELEPPTSYKIKIRKNKRKNKGYADMPPYAGAVLWEEGRVRRRRKGKNNEMRKNIVTKGIEYMQTDPKDAGGRSSRET
jgi:hypothetical protein